MVFIAADEVHIRVEPIKARGAKHLVAVEAHSQALLLNVPNTFQRRSKHVPNVPSVRFLRFLGAFHVLRFFA